MTNVEYWVVYDIATGDVRWRGQGLPGDGARQTLPEGLAATAVPIAALVGDTLDLEPVKLLHCARIDAEAEAVRSLVATPGSGQAMEYQEAVAQARAIVAGGAGPFPMLAADVAAGTLDPRSGVAVTSEQEAADVVLWAQAQWMVIGSAIRQARLSAKVAIRAATNIGALVTAASVDWANLS